MTMSASAAMYLLTLVVVCVSGLGDHVGLCGPAYFAFCLPQRLCVVSASAAIFVSFVDLTVSKASSIVEEPGAKPQHFVVLLLATLKPQVYSLEHA